MNQLSRNIVYCADRGGTGIWRRIFQADAVNSIGQSINVAVTCTQEPIIDQKYYQGMTSITCQRWINDQQRDLFCKFFKPLMDASSGWLIYEIDDNMSDQFIPKYNRGRAAFEGEQIQSNIKQMLNTADFVTVTTDYIKNFYHKHYGVPYENIIAVPNLLPRFWFDDKYDVDKKVEQFKKNKAKPRIGIVSSLSHYNIDNVMEDKNGLAARKKQKPDGTHIWVNEHNQEVPESDLQKITDDLDDIVECVRSTVNDFQWVFFGYCPPQIRDLADARKVEVHGGVPLLNYASTFYKLGLQAVIAPIKKTEFNFCKSHIKTMECAALGVPLYATNCLPYNRVMPTDRLFNDSTELKEKLLKLKFMSVGSYKSIIEQQWKWLNSPCHEGDFDINNYWLEDNLNNVWIPLFKLRQKGFRMSLSNFAMQYNKRKEDEAKRTIFKSESGEAKITL